MDDASLDERRLAFEERKWDADSKLRELEVAAKQRESTWAGRLFSPLTATLIAGVLTIAGTAIATLLQASSSLQLEKQKEQHELILKMAGVGDVDQARKNLNFLVETGLLTDPVLAEKIKNSKETPVLPRLAGLPNSPATSVIQVTPEEFARRASADAINLIVNFETGGGRASYEAHLKNPTWPGGASGITIGLGYDLGYVTEETFRSDWKPYLKSEELDRLALMIGIRGDDAKTGLSKVADISIRWEDALAVLTHGPLPRMATVLDNRLPNTKDLPPDCFGALVSLVYNRGAAFTAPGDRFTEMRNIRDLMDSKQFEGIPAQIRAMQRLWPNTGLSKRREQEAKLCEKGLAPRDAQLEGQQPQQNDTAK
jgi:GH24 family phage-related lysozyme (muramidase)